MGKSEREADKRQTRKWQKVKKVIKKIIRNDRVKNGNKNKQLKSKTRKRHEK